MAFEKQKFDILNSMVTFYLLISICLCDPSRSFLLFLDLENDGKKNKADFP